MKYILFILSSLFFCINAQTNASIVFVTTAPSGACQTRANLRYQVPNGNVFTCQSGTWAQISSGSGPPSGPASGALSGSYPGPTIFGATSAGAVPFVSSTPGILTQDFRSYSTNAELNFYANLASGNQCVIPAIGDSITYGTGSTPGTGESARAWSYQLASRLQQSYGWGGQGIVEMSGSAAGNIVTTGTWTGLQGVGPSQTVSTVITEVQYAAAAATATYTFSKPLDTIDIYYYQYTDNAAFTVTIDGVSQGNFGGTTQTSYTPAKVSFSSLAPGVSHTVLVTWVSGKVYLFGFGARITTGSGVSVMNVGVAGALSNLIDGTGPATSSKVSWLGQVPNLCGIIVGLSQNDAGINTPAVVVSNYAPMIAEAQSLGVPLLFFLPEFPQTTSGQAAIQTALKSLAISDGYDYISIGDRWGAYSAATGLWYTDGVHPSNAGHTDIALAFTQYFKPSNNTVSWGAFASNLSGLELPGFHAGYFNAPMVLDGYNLPELTLKDLAQTLTLHAQADRIYPGVDATTAWKILTANNVNVIFDVDSTNKRVLVSSAGGSSFLPQASLHVMGTGGIGTTAPTAGTLLFVDNGGATGNAAAIDIMAGATGAASIFFGKPTATAQGNFSYQQGSDWFNFIVAGANSFRVGYQGIVHIPSATGVYAIDGSTFGTADTGLSRDSAGVIDFGTGAQGSVAGSFKATSEGTIAVLTANLKTCTAGGSTPTGLNSYSAAVSDAVAPALGVVLTGGGTVWAHVHCSLTTGTYLVDGL